MVCLLCSPSQSALEVAFTQAATCPVYYRELLARFNRDNWANQGLST